MSACRRPIDRDAMRIDAEFSSVLSHPTNQVTRISHCFKGSNVLLVGKTIFTSYGDHPQFRKALRIVVSPLGTAGVPSASVKDDDRRVYLPFRGIGGLEDMRLNLGGTNGLIGANNRVRVGSLRTRDGWKP